MSFSLTLYLIMTWAMQKFKRGEKLQGHTEKTQLYCVFPGLDGAVCIFVWKKLQQPAQEKLKVTCMRKEAQAHWLLSEQGYSDLF